MPWSEWICCLAVSVAEEEKERHWQYVLAGGDPKKWTPWAKKPRGSRATRFLPELMKHRNIGHLKGDVDTFAKLRGFDRIAKLEDGRYFNYSTGEYYDKPPAGVVFVESR